MKLFLVSAIVAVAFCYDMDPSGYGGNDAEAVKKVAAASPRVRPRDYTSNGKPINDPVTIPKLTVPSIPSVGTIVGNKFDLTNLSQLNNQGQSSVQVGGEQTNVGSNANAINVGQTNQNAGSGKGSAGYPAPSYTTTQAPSYTTTQAPSYTTGRPSYPAPQYDSKYAPSYPAPNTYVPQIPSYGGAGAAGDLIKNNLFNVQNLGQTSSQGQENVQVGGAQTNVGSNSNAVNVGQTSQNGGQGSGAGYGAPQYDSKYAPSYPQPTYQQPSYAQYLPQNIFAGNKVDYTGLGQTNNQGQSNTQVGGAQTNVGSNENAINVGQTNQNGGQGSGAGYGAPQYDSKYAPSYPAPNTYVPQIPSYGGAGAAGDLIKNNLFNVQNLGQTSSQGQENVQVGGAQTNVGSNQNAINVGQTNQNGGQGSGAGYGAPQYDSKYAPSYPQPSYPQPSYGNAGAGYLPQNLVAGNLFNLQNLGQNNQQGQSSAQVGGAQTNVGSNENSINVGQTNNNGQQGSGSGYGAPQYDSYGKPSYGGQDDKKGNQEKTFSKTEANNVGVIGGLVGAVSNVLTGNQINLLSKVNNDAAGYHAIPVYPHNLAQLVGNKFDIQNLGQNNQQGQSNTQVGGAQTNVGQNTNTINVGQTNNNGGQGSGAPQYDSKYAPSYPQPTYQQPSYAQYLPQNIFAGNKVDYTGLGQTNNQGQSNTQVGGAQTNVGQNSNTINVGQTNDNGGQKTPSYDAKIKKVPEPEPEQSYRRRA